MSHDVSMFASVAVDAGVEITLRVPRTPDDESVSITFGSERMTLEFYDVASLARLRDVAQEAVQRLQAVTGGDARPGVQSTSDGIRW
jgi:hypothetical protein